MTLEERVYKLEGVMATLPQQVHALQQELSLFRQRRLEALRQEVEAYRQSAGALEQGLRQEIQNKLAVLIGVFAVLLTLLR